MTDNSPVSPSVFISHRHSDSPAAAAIVEGLTRHHFDVWAAEQGADWSQELRAAIQSADSIIVLISSGSVWQDSEISTLHREMDQRGVDIIPVLLGAGPVPKSLADRAVVDMTRPEASISDLVQRIDSGRSLSLLDLQPLEFEELVRDLLESEGFDVAGPAAGDRGYDLVARAPGTGSEESVEYLVEAKAYRHGRVSVSSLYEIAERVAGIGGDRRGMIVTNGQLTSVATTVLSDLAARPGAPELRVIDGVQLKYRLLNHPELARKYSRRTSGPGEQR